MARLPYLDKSDLLPEHQDLLARNINLYRLLAHSPRAARSLNTLARFIRDGSRLDPRLRQMAILQVGYVTRAAYEYSHHIRISRDFEVSDDDIRAIADETAGRPTALEPLAKAVLRAARDMTRESGDFRRNLCRAASGPRRRAPNRSLDHDRLLQRPGTPNGGDADRCRGRISRLSRRVPVAKSVSAPRGARITWSPMRGRAGSPPPGASRSGFRRSCARSRAACADAA